MARQGVARKAIRSRGISRPPTFETLATMLDALATLAVAWGLRPLIRQTSRLPTFHANATDRVRRSVCQPQELHAAIIIQHDLVELVLFEPGFVGERPTDGGAIPRMKTRHFIMGFARQAYPWYCHAIRGHNSEWAGEFNEGNDPRAVDGFKNLNRSKQRKRRLLLQSLLSPFAPVKPLSDSRRRVQLRNPLTR